jgi:hypothetical protein
MIELTCWGCGLEGQVPDSYEGRKVTCRMCLTENAVPDSVTREIDSCDWIAAMDPSTGSDTAEVYMRRSPSPVAD